jgi:hypothetical protein
MSNISIDPDVLGRLVRSVNELDVDARKRRLAVIHLRLEELVDEQCWQEDDEARIGS